MALMCLDALMPRKHLIETVILTYLASFLRKIFHLLLLGCFFPSMGFKNPQFSGTKLFQSLSQFLMKLDKVAFYHPYFSLSILINY